MFSQYLFQIPCTRFYKCHNLQVLQHLELKFGLWKEKTMIHVRFLLVAVIIQDIGLLLDSNNSGDLLFLIQPIIRMLISLCHFQ